ncbi:ribosomal protein S18 acetylase RimI-like enzyme [Amorphus suaedae]
MSDITIRLAEANDTGQLDTALRHLSEAIGDPHGATPEQLREAGFGTHPAFRAQIAEAGCSVVGIALYSPVFSTVRAGAGLYVSDLWVATSVRGAGLGQRLLAAAARDAEAVWGAKFLKLVVYDGNSRARTFYDRLGFIAASGETTLTLDAAGFASLAASQDRYR